MKRDLLVSVVASILLATLANTFSQTVTLQWNASTDPDVIGYNLYYGVASQTYTNVIPADTSATTIVSNLSIGLTYYFTATSINSAGLESAYSDEVSYQIGTPPCGILLSDLVQTYDGTPKSVSVTTVPGGLPYSVNYGGMPYPPVEAGSYPVSVSIADPNYSTTVTETLTIIPPNATVQLDGLDQIYDGTPKAVLVTTAPLDLAVTVTYNGMIDPPTDAGTYEVTATVVDPAFSAAATATLTIFQADAVIQFGDLNQVYNGAPEPVAVTTLPSGLNVVVTYDGLTQAPSDVGTYTVTGSIDDPNYSGFAMDLLTIASSGPTAPISPRTPASGVAWQVLGAGQVFLLCWTNNSPGITVWQSADLATWTQLTNFTTASGSLSIVPQDGVRFFRATVSGPNRSQAIPLWLGFPAKSTSAPAESTAAN